MRLTNKTVQPSQVWDENLNVTPVAVERSMRVDEKRILTSGYAGKFLPIAAIPLLREDSVRNSRMRVSVEMAETAEMLANAVQVRVRAYAVSKLAFERFNGLDSLNRSYKGEPEIDGQVLPWFEQDGLADAGVPRDIYKVLGVHSPSAGGDLPVSTDYMEAYNAIWNFEASERSPSLELRHHFDSSLAPAFWSHTAFKHVKPSFDSAMIDGQVPLNVTSADIYIKGLAVTSGAQDGGFGEGKDSEGEITAYQQHVKTSDGNSVIVDVTGSPGQMRPKLIAELEQAGISISVANIDMARETAAWARVRNSYQGITDEYMIDLLMEGIAIPELMMKRPMLIADQQTIIGMAQRYATDSGNLDKSATRGMTYVDLNLRVPRLNTGGVLMVVAEIVPEQTFERRKDHYLCTGTTTAENMPNHLNDILDPEPVTVVQNSDVDTDHDQPTGVFGYAPLNHEWIRNTPNIGGKFYRGDASAAWTEVRSRIWAAEQQNPKLGTDFYLAGNIHHDVFADQNTDPFEIMAVGRVMIEGNTYFGPALREATDDYQTILDDVDQDRIDQDQVTAQALPGVIDGKGNENDKDIAEKSGEVGPVAGNGADQD